MIWSDVAIDYKAGLVITDPQSHEQGTVCRTPQATTQNCRCPNAKWYTDEEAHQQPPEVRSRLTMRPKKRGTYVLK